MNLMYEINKIPTNWKQIILSYPKLNDIIAFLEKEEKQYGSHLPIFPNIWKIFNCFTYFNVEETAVVILGQDPYHGPNQANGLCFATLDVIPAPPSLRNIKKELKMDINKELVSNTLIHWAKQKILLLNTALTVRWKSPTSHMKIWLPFTKYIIKHLNNQKKIVFVAWGAFAYDKLKDIDSTKHTLLVSSHPSPFSANRSFQQFPSFIGSKVFSNINKNLEIPIDF